MKLAQQLIDQQASDKFDPSAYTDEVRARVVELLAAEGWARQAEGPAGRSARQRKLTRRTHGVRP